MESASYRLPGCVGLMFEEELNLLNRLPARWTDGLPETEGEKPVNPQLNPPTASAAI